MKLSEELSEKYMEKIKKQEKIIAVSLCIVLFLPSINNFLNCFLQIGLSKSVNFITPSTYIFMAATTVFFLYKLVLKKKSLLGIFLFFLLGVGLSYLIYPEIRDLLYDSPVDLVYSPVNKLFFFCIPALIGAACLTDYNIFFNKMQAWGRIACVMGIITYCFVCLIVGKNLQYMVFSYHMLLPICVCFEHARIKSSVIDFIIAVGGAICILMCGARGAVLSLLFYFFVTLFFRRLRRLKKTVVIFMFVLMVFALFSIFYYQEILLAMADIFDELGIQSRFVTSVLEGGLFEDRGRTAILQAILKGVKNNPLGYGLYGDRYVIGTFGFSQYTYAHNIFLEMICDFGIIGGSVLILLITYRIIKMLSFYRDSKEAGVLLALLPYGVFQLLFSSTFMENIPFFIIIAKAFFSKWKR